MDSSTTKRCASWLTLLQRPPPAAGLIAATLRDRVRSWYGSNIAEAKAMALMISNWAAGIKRKYHELSFGDRLNGALFCLTILSLVIAFWGVRIAYVTLKEARAGGEKQQATLDASKDALLAAKTSLDASTTLLRDQTTIQNDTLVAIRQADSLLHETTIAAANQTTLLKSINDQPTRRGILAASLACSDPDRRQQQSPTDLIGETENKKFHAGRGHSTFDLKLVEGAIYSCKLTVRNIGNQKIEQFEVTPLALGLRGVQVSSGHQGDPESWQVLFGDTGPDTAEAVGRIGPPAFFSFTPSFGGTLLPVAQDPIGQSSEFRLRLLGDQFHNPSRSKPGINLRLGPVNVPYDYIAFPIIRLPQR
jgi:hypothetical protein